MSVTANKRIGFTIVELLIVIVVIAILAAISVVAFRGVQNRANDSAVEADLANIVKQMEIIKVDLGRYPHGYTEFPADRFKLTKSAYDSISNNAYYIVDIQNDRYAFGFRSKSGRGYIINTGVVTSGVTPLHSGSTSGALGIDWANDPGVSAVFQAYVGGSTQAWTAYWNWVN